MSWSNWFNFLQLMFLIFYTSLSTETEYFCMLFHENSKSQVNHKIFSCKPKCQLAHAHAQFNLVLSCSAEEKVIQYKPPLIIYHFHYSWFFSSNFLAMTCIFQIPFSRFSKCWWKICLSNYLSLYILNHQLEFFVKFSFVTI